MVLGPVLFLIYIDNVDVGIINLISKFAEDTKIGNSVLSDDDKQSLQDDFHKISASSDRWEMPFNVDKWQVLQVGTRNKKFDYDLRGIKLKSVQCTKDLGVKIASNLKFSQQCVDAANKANRMLGFINPHSVGVVYIRHRLSHLPSVGVVYIRRDNLRHTP